jgi:glycerol-3-phosphate acyltransferase PlsY
VEMILIILAYLAGSVPSGYVLGRFAGVDVRKAGSGNVGATNVARVAGKTQGVLTLVADAAKGFVPVFAALQLDMSLTATTLVGIAAFLGHLYPVFLLFRGGKGVATALGVFLALAPFTTLLLLGVFLMVAACSRFVSLSSMSAAVAAPIALWIAAYPPLVVQTGAFLAAMIILRHRSNIKRLLAGTEPRFNT